jgi:hypothetical protein
MKKTLVIFAIFLFNNLFAQQLVEQRQLVDLPTAGTLDKGSYSINLRMFGNGGLLTGVSVGTTPRFMLGLTFGGENIIGEGNINWNPEPGIQARIRLIDEDFAVPAIAIGFNSQGYGPFIDAFDRYENKSRGIYAIASKNFAVLFNLGFHGGLNLSLEDDDKDQELNIFLGADLSLNREFRLFLEYDLANNDNENDAQFGSGSGYLNSGIQWTFSDRLMLQFYMKNLLKNGPGKVTREFKIEYFEYF